MRAQAMLMAGAFFGLTATLLGAFGAHALKTRLDAAAMAAYQAGVSYQFVHALALLATGLLALRAPSTALSVAGGLFVAGILCFSGSLYLLSTRQMLGWDGLRLLGPVTPLGGLCFLAGWAALMVAAWRLTP